MVSSGASRMSIAVTSSAIVGFGPSARRRAGRNQAAVAGNIRRVVAMNLLPSDFNKTRGRARRPAPCIFWPLLRRCLLQFLHDFIQVEAGRLLPLRVILERHQELAD